jgi:hypothetical protein
MEAARLLPIVVQFGIGALLCVAGLAAGLRSGYLDMKLPNDRRLVRMVVLGYAALLLLSLAFTVWLPYLAPEVAR